MKILLSITLVLISAAALSAAAPQVIPKGKAPIVVLPRYLPSASAAENNGATSEDNAGAATMKLEKFVVTGSLVPKAEKKVSPRMHFAKH